MAHESLLGPIQPNAKEIEGCKAQPSSLLKSKDPFCPKWGVSLVDKLGERQSRKIFSPVDEVLLSEAARFQDTMSISLSEAEGTLSSTPFCGAVKEACWEVGLIC